MTTCAIHASWPAFENARGKDAVLEVLDDGGGTLPAVADGSLAGALGRSTGGHPCA